jgi:hypothetical protein
MTLQERAETFQGYGYINAAVMFFSVGSVFLAHKHSSRPSSLHANLGVASVLLTALAFATSVYKTHFSKGCCTADYSWYFFLDELRFVSVLHSGSACLTHDLFWLARRSSTHRVLGLLSHVACGGAILGGIQGFW